MTESWNFDDSSKENQHITCKLTAGSTAMSAVERWKMPNYNDLVHEK